MTDEEKAKEYAKSILHCELCTRCNRKQDKINNKCEQFHFLYGGYLDGLAEGRKEQEKKDSEKITVLEKENAELQKDKEWLDNTNNEQTKVILQLNEQIGKMKCCENCKNHYWNYGDLDCRLEYSCYDTDYDKWEMMK